MSDMNQQEISFNDLIWRSICRLDAWLSKNGWAGWDPYDIRGTLIFFSLQRARSLPLKILKKGVRFLEHRAPIFMRKLFGVRPHVNSKAMGLFASSYLILWEKTGNNAFLEKANQCLEWLKANYNRDYPGMSWGYPFGWQSIIFYPKMVPYGVTTAFVVDAFYKHYKLTGSEESLKICNEVCRFFLEGLNRDVIDEKSICFSFSPLDRFHVHNANLLVAEFLIRFGTEVKNDEWVSIGLRAANYALKEQNPDGSIYYFGQDQNHYNPNHLDHYHSGFEIRCLEAIARLTGLDRFKRSAEKYYAFYLQNYFTPEWIPKISPKSVYPVNIHACAEALLCNAFMAETHPEAMVLLPKVTRWTIENMQTGEGWFIYMVLLDKFSKRPRKVKIPMIRWGQAWMLRGLAELTKFT